MKRTEGATPPVYAQLKAECLGLRALFILTCWGYSDGKFERTSGYVEPALHSLCFPIYERSFLKWLLGTALEYMEKDLTEAEKLISHEVLQHLVLPLIIMLCWQLGCVLPCGKVIILLPENMRKIYELWNRFCLGKQKCIGNELTGESGFDFSSEYLWYLQPIITQYFIDNKSEIWLLFLIAHSKKVKI